jgi:uncharacterized protein (TIGR02145 family)
MKKLLTILFAVALGLNLSAQDDCEPSPDFNQDGVVGMNDLLTLLSAFGDFDLDFDGIWDSVDDCIGVYDPCGVCNGTGEDADEDGLCDDVDDCVGEYDECGVCNGPGPNIPVIDEILYATDSVFLDPLDEWYVFEYATDTLFTFVCPVSGCMDETAGNYNPEAVIEDGSCVYGPLECGGASTVTFDGYTYDLVAIGDQCWFAENLCTEHYANGDVIHGELNLDEWEYTTEGAQAIYNNDASNLADYGRLYNWYAVDDARGLCLSGWHVPSDEEFMELEMELGMSEAEVISTGLRGTNQGTQLKSSPGDNPSWNGTNTTGFSGLAGGMRNYVVGVDFVYEGSSGYYWSSSPWGTNHATNRQLRNESTGVVRTNINDNRYGFSVRCVRD